jgi:hypothetical protein
MKPGELVSIRQAEAVPAAMTVRNATDNFEFALFIRAGAHAVRKSVNKSGRRRSGS